MTTVYTTKSKTKTPRFILYRGLCIWPVQESNSKHYAEITNQAGVTVRETTDSPVLTTRDAAVTNAKAWADLQLIANAQASRSWQPPQKAVHS